ncbi:hypothetical protein NPX79_01070 [Spiroplasma endosymbiont of Anurida maritima]|uniref:hypothetical protein n=1 Tax=Spiroplasma endosymbiont of Anurida maritima TaxID=2967972 RepID=UPI0036D30F8C
METRITRFKEIRDKIKNEIREEKNTNYNDFISKYFNAFLIIDKEHFSQFKRNFDKQFMFARFQIQENNELKPYNEDFLEKLYRVLEDFEESNNILINKNLSEKTQATIINNEIHKFDVFNKDRFFKYESLINEIEEKDSYHKKQVEPSFEEVKNIKITTGNLSFEEIKNIRKKDKRVTPDMLRIVTQTTEDKTQKLFNKYRKNKNKNKLYFIMFGAFLLSIIVLFVLIFLFI